MPGRRPDADPAAELERRRAMDRERKRNQRSRDRARAVSRDGHVTPGQGTARPVTPPAPPVPSSLSLLERKKIEHLLSGFAPRGYAHDERFWELLRSRYPLLDLELEVMKLAEWLDVPKNARRKCSKAFLANWMQRADADRAQREAQPRPVAPHGMPYQPPSPGKPPDPAPVLPPDVVLERIPQAVADRALLEAKRFTLSEKLAMAKNGSHR